MLNPQSTQLFLGYNCYLDVETWELVKDSHRIALSPIQYRILLCLTENLGSLVTVKELIKVGWGSKSEISASYLYDQVKRIRNRLEDDKPARCLLTVYGQGYILYPRDNR